MTQSNILLESDDAVEFAHERNRAGASLASQQIETAAKTIQRAILMRNQLSQELLEYRLRMKSLSHSAGHLPAPLEELPPVGTLHSDSELGGRAISNPLLHVAGCQSDLRESNRRIQPHPIKRRVHPISG